jgi:hypothetical protein
VVRASDKGYFYPAWMAALATDWFSTTIGGSMVAFYLYHIYEIFSSNVFPSSSSLWLCAPLLCRGRVWDCITLMQNVDLMKCTQGAQRFWGSQLWIASLSPFRVAHYTRAIPEAPLALTLLGFEAKNKNFHTNP